jgi:predicted MFS family arabinose efflux permease
MPQYYKHTPSRDWWLLLGLALGVTVTNGFARFAYGLILPSMRAELGWTYAQAGWLNTANAMGYIAGAILTMALIGRIPPARLFAFGLVTTTLSLLATGLVPALGWQTFWRIAAGLFGAMSFSTAGALTAGLFADAPRKNALAIAILFGSGGGLGIVLAGASIPPMLGFQGDTAWPWAWVMVGSASLLMTPPGLWAAWHLRNLGGRAATKAPLPLRQMLPEYAGYASFGLGYIVYLTFLSAWMREQAASPLHIALTWVLLGACITVSPFLWRGIFARFASGAPLAMILTGIAIGSALPVLWPGPTGLVTSALVFGLCVFMAPGAVTNFARQNLDTAQWGRAISLFTVVFAFAQTAGPYAAGWIGDIAGSIGLSLLVAAGLLLSGAMIALLQKPLRS